MKKCKHDMCPHCCKLCAMEEFGFDEGSFSPPPKGE